MAQLSAPLRASLDATVKRYAPDLERVNALQRNAATAATAAASAITAHRAAASRAVRIGPAPAAPDLGPMLSSVAEAANATGTAYGRLTVELVAFATGACDSVDAVAATFTAALADRDRQIATLKAELATAKRPFVPPNQYGRQP